MDKYYIDIETMYTQGTGSYYMISPDKTNIEMLRMELLHLFTFQMQILY